MEENQFFKDYRNADPEHQEARKNKIGNAMKEKDKYSSQNIPSVKAEYLSPENLFLFQVTNDVLDINKAREKFEKWKFKNRFNQVLKFGLPAVYASMVGLFSAYGVNAEELVDSIRSSPDTPGAVITYILAGLSAYGWIKSKQIKLEGEDVEEDLDGKIKGYMNNVENLLQQYVAFKNSSSNTEAPQ